MFDPFFIIINEWMAGTTALAALGCFIWGVISVLFSPCHLASIPLIVAYVGGHKRTISPKQAAVYSVLFTTGLFITITTIGVICALLGRMLGDIGNYWQILIGGMLIWIALGMLGIEKCSMPGNFLYRIKVRGIFGALVLGLAYGVLSGTCTFGFIAPILAIITVQKEIATGILFILLFAAGHCLPIVIAGSSTAAVRKIMENNLWQKAENRFRIGTGITIGLLGLYFVINPLLTT